MTLRFKLEEGRDIHEMTELHLGFMTPLKPKLQHQDSLPRKTEDESRGHWGSRTEFVLSCIGYSVGLGNVWRFPFLAYENGGGAFLIPYIIILIFIGKPMYFMEAALGQFAQVGPVAMWREMLPAGIGVGVAMAIVSAIVAIYYNVIMAYSLFYLFNSFRTVLPWTTCDPSWGADERCYLRSGNLSASDLQGVCVVDDLGGCTESGPQPATEQYWERAVLDIDHEGLQVFGDLGEVKMDLAFFLLLSWMIVNVCVMKGVKSSGKVVYFTATFPYAVLLILLIRGLTLEGAAQGVAYLFIPKWSKLADLSVWMAAAGQVFFSLGISWGGIIMFGSYNRVHDRVHIDAHIVSGVDFITSLIASIVIFSTLGHTAHNLGVPIETVAKGGQGLAFVAYPEALSQLPAPHFWCCLFFSMLFLLGLDSEFALFETVLDTVYDAFPNLRKRKVEVTSCISFLFFLLGIPCITQKGQYVLDIMDTYGASISVMIIAVFEMMVIMWIYGVKRFCKDVQSMLGFEPNMYFKVCWAGICPVLLLFIFMAQSYNWRKPSYGTIQYPEWAHSIGWLLALVSIIQIPLWFLIILGLKALRGERIASAWESTASWLKRRNCSPSKPDFMSTLNHANVIDSQCKPKSRFDKFMDIFGRGSDPDEIGKKIADSDAVSTNLCSSFMSIRSGTSEVSSENEKSELRPVAPPVVPSTNTLSRTSQKPVKSVTNGGSIVGFRVPPPPPPAPTVDHSIVASTPQNFQKAELHAPSFQNAEHPAQNFRPADAGDQSIIFTQNQAQSLHSAQGTEVPVQDLQRTDPEPLGSAKVALALVPPTINVPSQTPPPPPPMPAMSTPALPPMPSAPPKPYLERSAISSSTPLPPPPPPSQLASCRVPIPAPSTSPRVPSGSEEEEDSWSS